MSVAHTLIARASAIGQLKLTVSRPLVTAGEWSLAEKVSTARATNKSRTQLLFMMSFKYPNLMKM